MTEALTDMMGLDQQPLNGVKEKYPPKPASRHEKESLSDLSLDMVIKNLLIWVNKSKFNL